MKKVGLSEKLTYLTTLSTELFKEISFLAFRSKAVTALRSLLMSLTDISDIACYYSCLESDLYLGYYWSLAELLCFLLEMSSV